MDLLIGNSFGSLSGLIVALISYGVCACVTSLLATIAKHHPHVLEGRDSLITKVTALPIPDTMPPSFLAQHASRSVEGVGEPMTACFLSHDSLEHGNW